MFLSKHEFKKLARQRCRKEVAAREWAYLTRNFEMPYQSYTEDQRVEFMRALLADRHDIIAENRSRARCGVVPLDQARALPQVTRDLYGVSGVYFLWDGPRLVYIGSSRDVRGRCLAHARERGRLITAATYIAAHDSFMLRLEEFLIKAHRPTYNTTWCKRRRTA